MSINFLEIKNTTFVASKLNKVLDFNLTIKNEGDIICLLGPSGVGKTTILRSIAGLQKIPKGSISLKGKVISSEKKHIEPEKRNIALQMAAVRSRQCLRSVWHVNWDLISCRALSKCGLVEPRVCGR